MQTCIINVWDRVPDEEADINVPLVNSLEESINNGIMEAGEFDYCVIKTSDIIIHDDFVPICLQVIQNSRWGAIYSDYLIKNVPVEVPSFNADDLASGFKLNITSLISAKVFKAVGLLNPNENFWLKVVSKFPLYHIPCYGYKFI